MKLLRSLMLSVMLVALLGTVGTYSFVSSPTVIPQDERLGG